MGEPLTDEAVLGDADDVDKAAAVESFGFSELHLRDADRVQVHVREKLLRVAAKLGVVSAGQSLFLSYSFFLVHCLFRMSGPWQIDESLRLSWLASGSLEELSEVDCATMQRVVPHMDASQRRRIPRVLRLYHELSSWTDRTSSSSACRPYWGLHPRAKKQAFAKQPAA